MSGRDKRRRWRTKNERTGALERGGEAGLSEGHDILGLAVQEPDVRDDFMTAY